jgi:putative tryptophan/tyrosine transport system substrate-binding protein
MRRREFIAGLGGAVALPVVVRAQQSGGLRRIGVLMNGFATDMRYQSELSTFIQELKQLGWIEGKNVQIDIRWNAGDAELAKIYTAQLIGLMPEVIVAYATLSLAAIRQATSTVPVVFLRVSDPVAQGFVASMKQPGGNLTGFSRYEFAIGGKWLGLLREAAPSLVKIAVMFNPEIAPQSKYFMRAIDEAASSLNMNAAAMPLRSVAEIEPALATFASMPNSGLMLPSDTFTREHQMLIADLAARYRLPSIADAPNFAKDGGLMDYGNRNEAASQFRQAATYVDRILKGSKPGELPVQQPDKYALAINAKTAKALGLTLPPTLLAVADEVIE